jgi:protoporphyrinogen oxidase
MLMNEKIVILGGGPAGMATAWQLAERGKRVVLLEKCHDVGGMARTIEFQGCQVDFGPHIIHVRDTEESIQLIQEIKRLLGHEPLLLQHNVRVLLQKKFYHYPWQISELLFKLNPLLSTRVLLDYILANMKHLLVRNTDFRSFEEWGVKNVGRTLYDLAIGHYSRKVWGIPTSEISVRQAQRVAKINLRVLILRLLGINADPVAHFRQYIYPHGGIRVLFQQMTKRIEEAGGEVIRDAGVCGIHMQDGTLQGVEYLHEGKSCFQKADFIVSTIPLPSLIPMFQPKLPACVQNAGTHLYYRGLIIVYVLLDRPRYSSTHWTYLIDDEYHCNRVSEQKSVCAEMVPPDQTALCFEITCTDGDGLSRASDGELFELVCEDAHRAKIFSRKDVLHYELMRFKDVYPVYRVGFEEELTMILKELHSMNNFATIGRHGLFLNNSMDDNILLGKMLAGELAQTVWHKEHWEAKMTQYLSLVFQGKK